MAKGSLAELQTQVLLATRMGFASQAETNEVLERATSVSFLLQSLRKALNAKLPRDPHSPFPIPPSPLCCKAPSASPATPALSTPAPAPPVPRPGLRANERPARQNK